MQFGHTFIAKITSPFAKHVAVLFKDPAEIARSIESEKADLIHAVLGVAGESGELVDAVKRHVIYGRELDRENVVEELGDLRFYMQAIQNRLGITDDEVETANVEKLKARYPQGYTDAHANARLDKAGE